MANPKSKGWVIREESEELVLYLRDPTDFYFRATVKWDGCFELQRMFNGGDWDDENAFWDSIHICEFDDLIERLQDLKRAAKDYFKDTSCEW